MRPFRHVDARSVEEACALLAGHGSAARLVAGGTDLLGVLKDDIHPTYPELVVNLKTVPGLAGIAENDGGLEIGPLTTLLEIASSPVVESSWSALADAARSVAAPQIRAMGTIGGNLCQEVRCWYYRYSRHVGGPVSCLRKGGGSCPAVKGDNRHHAIMRAPGLQGSDSRGARCFAVCPSDTAVALAALDATLCLVDPAGTRTIPVLGLFGALGTTLRPAEVVAGIRIPTPLDGTRQTYLKATVRTTVDFALAGVAAAVRVEDGLCAEARIVLGAVAPTPVHATAAEQALLGRPLDAGTIAHAAETAVESARPLRRNGHKVEIARALVARALDATSSRP